MGTPSLKVEKSFTFTNDDVNEIPQNITHLCIEYDYDLPLTIGSIQNSVKYLQFGYDYTQNCTKFKHSLSVGIIPNSVISLFFDCNLKEELTQGIIPNSVKELFFGKDYHQHIHANVIPNSVTRLEFGGRFNQPLVTCDGNIIPNSVTHLKFGEEFNQPLMVGAIPNSVTHLTFGWHFNQPLVSGAIPNSVTHLTFGNDFNQPLVSGAIPNSVTHLKFGARFNQTIYDFTNLDTKSVKTTENCVICLESKSSIITMCNHQFCTSCIQDWVKINKSCAYCRKDLINSDLFLIKCD